MLLLRLSFLPLLFSISLALYTPLHRTASNLTLSTYLSKPYHALSNQINPAIQLKQPVELTKQ
jgi:hypothetical protein